MDPMWRSNLPTCCCPAGFHVVLRLLRSPGSAQAAGKLATGSRPVAAMPGRAVSRVKVGRKNASLRIKLSGQLPSELSQPCGLFSFELPAAQEPCWDSHREPLQPRQVSYGSPGPTPRAGGGGVRRRSGKSPAPRVAKTSAPADGGWTGWLSPHRPPPPRHQQEVRRVEVTRIPSTPPRPPPAQLHQQPKRTPNSNSRAPRRVEVTGRTPATPPRAQQQPQPPQQQRAPSSRAQVRPPTPDAAHVARPYHHPQLQADMDLGTPLPATRVVGRSAPLLQQQRQAAPAAAPPLPILPGAVQHSPAPQRDRTPTRARLGTKPPSAGECRRC